MNVSWTVRPETAKYKVLEKPAGEYIPSDDHALSNTAKLHQLHPFLVYLKKKEKNVIKKKQWNTLIKNNSSEIILDDQGIFFPQEWNLQTLCGIHITHLHFLTFSEFSRSRNLTHVWGSSEQTYMSTLWIFSSELVI